MPVVHKTTCEYCLGPVDYSNSSLLKDRFDMVFIICPLCGSQVEVELPDDIDLEDVLVEGEEDISDHKYTKSRRFKQYERESDDDIEWESEEDD